MDGHGIASPEEWVAARKTLVQELTRLRDRFVSGGFELPWATVETTFAFDTPNGMEAPAGLFDGGARHAHVWTGLLDKLERYLGMNRADACCHSKA
jgi:predicted dithiol-disulfide oxidoreductase (DUF899 family)